jgi:hypothetical protein
METSVETAAQPASPPSAASALPPALAFWIRTPCGRAKYQALAVRPGGLARLRLGWFVLIAALRDLAQPLPPEEGSGPSA